MSTDPMPDLQLASLRDVVDLLERSEFSPDQIRARQLRCCLDEIDRLRALLARSFLLAPDETVVMELPRRPGARYSWGCWSGCRIIILDHRTG